MTDIELVVRIDEKLYKDIYSDAEIMIYGGMRSGKMLLVTLLKAIRNGTPLPKGHGDLIDRNELLKHYDSTTYHNGIEERKIHFVQIGYVNDAPTIIKADKESEVSK